MRIVIVGLVLVLGLADTSSALARSHGGGSHRSGSHRVRFRSTSVRTRITRRSDGLVTRSTRIGNQTWTTRSDGLTSTTTEFGR
jgi:hypothetical protein